MHRLLLAAAFVLAGTSAANAHDRLAPVVAVVPENGRLLSVNPYPDRTVDSTARPGFVQPYRTAATPLQQRLERHYALGGGPIEFGAPISMADDLIGVRVSALASPVLISPWDSVNEATADEIRRQLPFVRDDGLVNDLRLSRNQFLEQRGYILNVRSFGGSPASVVRRTRAQGNGGPAPRVLPADDVADRPVDAVFASPEPEAAASEPVTEKKQAERVVEPQETVKRRTPRVLPPDQPIR
jgi:hypothetical protein